MSRQHEVLAIKRRLTQASSEYKAPIMMLKGTDYFFSCLIVL